MVEVVIQVPILLAVVEVEGVTAGDEGSAAKCLDGCARAYHERYATVGVAAPGAVDGVAVARALFHALRIDPTRHRPCSEALLNRALKGRPQPRVNGPVDVGNWCALDFLLPLGVYDRDRIEGGVRLRVGAAGESYDAISGRVLNLADRYVLADEGGPFGSPITDSRRTSVTETTRNLIVFLYAPEDYDSGRLAGEARILAERTVEHCGGHATRCEVITA